MKFSYVKLRALKLKVIEKIYIFIIIHSTTFGISKRTSVTCTYNVIYQIIYICKLDM